MKSTVYCFKVDSPKDQGEFDKTTASGCKPIARRISRACDECRKRKTRCIAEGRACQLCNSRSKLCSYDAPSFKRGPKPKKQVPNIGEQQIKLENVKPFFQLNLPSPPNNFNPDISGMLSSSLTPNHPSSEMVVPLVSGDGKEISSYIQRLYAQGSIICLTPSQLNIVINYFYFLHDQNILLDPSRFVLYLSSPIYPTSFKFLLNCLFVATTRNLPHLQEEYINLYSTDIITKELENLDMLMNSFFNNEREIDMVMNRELGLSLMNLSL